MRFKTALKANSFTSVLLALALASAYFVSFPTALYAATETELASQIAGFNPVNGGSSTGQLTAIANTASHTVTVTGNVTGATKVLDITISSNVKVIWKASLAGTPDDAGLIVLRGEGTFIVDKEGYLECSQGFATLGSYDLAPTIQVIGGTVVSTGLQDAIRSDGNVEIIGGTVIAKEGLAIQATGPNAVVQVAGGRVSNCSGTPTIKSRSIYIRDGAIVTNLGEGKAVEAVGRDSCVVLDDGVISARTGYAIYQDDEGYVYLNSGFVFANGTIVSGNYNDVTVQFMGEPIMENNGIICCWNPPALAPFYDEGTSTDLTMTPTEATATWGMQGDQAGLYYTNGTNTGFCPVPGNITVNLIPGSSSSSGQSSGGENQENGTETSNGKADNAGKEADGSNGSVFTISKPLAVVAVLAIIAISSGVTYIVVKRKRT